MNFRKYLVLLLLTVFQTVLHAQVVINSAGGNAIGNGGFASYSVGQVACITNIGSDGSVALGVQQPIEISTLTGLFEPKNIKIMCSVYPNPATALVQLKVDFSTVVSIQSINYQLIDLQGKILKSGKIKTDITNIQLSKLCAATYLLKVIEDGNEYKVFKIIKNQ